jgi:hypothetical protein
MAPSWPNGTFPNLGSFDETSPFDPRYNCIAFAAGDDQQWWEPDPSFSYYWPANIPREYTVDAYTRAYEVLGYVPCGNDSSVEPDHDKVCLYARSTQQGMEPTHAALQEPDGRWKSKCGRCEDIVHDTPDALNSPRYGAPFLFLKRPRSKP